MRTLNSLAIVIIFLVLMQPAVPGLTASIGNSRMVLRVAPGEDVERYILVRNVNNESVTIELFASGDLTENIELAEESFVLAAGEEKKAYFTIKSNEPGTTETKINVAFKPEEGNGAGLSSTVILIVDEKYKTTGGELMNNSSQISFNAIFEDIKKIVLAALGIIAPIILLVILLLMFVYMKNSRKTKKKKKKSVTKIDE